MEFDRDDVQTAIAYFLGMCVITSEKEDEEDISLRYNFIAMAAIRCHLFNDTDQKICGDIIMMARDIILLAVECDKISEESEKQAKILAASGFAETAVASIVDYVIYFDELDDMRSQLIYDICDAAGLDAKQTISSMAPAFNAIYKEWS